MKKIILISFFALCNLSVIGQVKNVEYFTMEKNLNDIQLKQMDFDKRLQWLSITLNKDRADIRNLRQSNKTLNQNLDSLKKVCDNLKNTQVADRKAINDKMENTNNTISLNQSAVKSRTLWGGIIAIFVFLSLIAIFIYLINRIKKEVSSIDEVRKVQDALYAAHVKMQEESIKLDNKMIELFEKQMLSVPIVSMKTQTDHSLALKVADEIIRIEMNLSRMDASIKGYKQLTKAVQRIKDNFNANGYEIVDMLGKPYNAGMKAAVTFITDENFEHGQQIITKIIKPQINYQQQMIQAAQIEVSQPE